MSNTNAPSIFVGKKKKAVCRLHKSKNVGVCVNKLPVEKYFDNKAHAHKINNLLQEFGIDKTASIACRVCGGGKTSQHESVFYALAKFILNKFSSENPGDENAEKRNEYKQLLRSKGALLSDRRDNEMKKYGKHKSRKGKSKPKR